jgi:hypothetical protein
MGKSYSSTKERLPYQGNSSSTVLLLKTNFIPSVKLCITGSPIFGFIIGFLSCDKIATQKRTDKKTVH